MKKRYLSLAIVVTAVFLGLWGAWKLSKESDGKRELLSGTNQSQIVNATSNPPSASNAGQRKLELARSGMPKLFKMTNYPPVTSAEKALWEWRQSMSKQDPAFAWKMPIDFYGKVVDQFGNAVDGAVVEYGWTTVVGPSPDPKGTMFSGVDGRFAISGIQGKRLGIHVGKPGYVYRGSNVFGSFEYGDFTSPLFHTPDPNNPVLFKLQKLLGGEPMYRFRPHRSQRGGGVLTLHVESGNFTPQGDLSCQVTVGKEQGVYKQVDYEIRFEGVGGALLKESSEEFLNEAPDSGYQKSITITGKATDPDYQSTRTVCFYVKTKTGRFASVEAEITISKIVSYSYLVYFNPSGSRNLEFDESKCLNRWAVY